MQHFQQSPTDPDFVQNPYPFYDLARSAGDFFWWEDYQMACAVSYDAVHATLRDKRMGRACPAELASSIPDQLSAFYAVEANSMLAVEPPLHTRLRGQVMRAFTSKTIANFEPEIIQLCHDLIDQFPDEPFDLLTAFAQPLPVTIICRLLGVPESHADDLLQWSNDMVAMYQARRSTKIEADAENATQAFCAFLQDHIDKKRHNPGYDLLSTLIAPQDTKKQLNADELISTAILLLNAGHEATVHTIGNGVKTLLYHGLSDVTDACVEEIMRYDPPLHMFTRWVYEDLKLGEHEFKRGDQIGCLLAAANRDPGIFLKPHQFDPTRKATPHTSLGGGIHFCVGAPLARLELQLGLRVLFQRCPSLKLAAPPAYANVYHFHGLETLMVTKG